jgi:hypothetical protein
MVNGIYKSTIINYRLHTAGIGVRLNCVMKRSLIIFTLKKNITRALKRGRPINSSPVTLAVKPNCPSGDYKGTGQC